MKFILLSFIPGLTFLLQAAQNTELYGRGVVNAEHLSSVYRISIPFVKTAMTAVYNLVLGIHL